MTDIPKDSVVQVHEVSGADSATGILKSEANKALLTGAGIGVFGSTLAATTGFVCPVCILATPLFLGYGGYQKYKEICNRSKTSSTGTDGEEP
jgi:hypothetical protein